ncbi:response regulator [Cellulophaga baltica]|uniref:response regulator n=1 Tax=Cellulophaga TaxID=104264 RepID=UPI001C070499|nr:MULTISPECIES: response regulator [Cellulophaga]MBU2994971.1 response regulator [Cellulophaga baltica]MDO6766366.1 response regulator [Cellulophaga sp. 1_MG-2023]
MRIINAINIIDDDTITVFGIRKLITTVAECNDIKTYNNGKLALNKLRDIIANNETLPDIIFLDLNMPIMDGWEFLEEFIALPIEKIIKINIVTSSINKEDRDKSELYKCRTHHCLSYNTKPLNVEEMKIMTTPL